MSRTGSNAASRQQQRRTFSSVFWDLILSSTGFRKDEIDTLRQTSNPKDICETPTSDSFDWAGEGVIDKLRVELAEYLETLRTLQDQNSMRKTRSLKVKSFIEDTRYKAAREKEGAAHIDTSKIKKKFQSLNLTQMKIDDLTDELWDFSNVQELIMTNNLVAEVKYLPPNVQIVSFSGNGIVRVDSAAIASAPHLAYISLALNNLSSDLSFLKASTSLVVVDLSYNEISDMATVVAALKDHPSIKEIDLLGNPIALLPHYREILAKSTALEVLDGVPISDEERKFFQTDAQVAEAMSRPPSFTLVFDGMEGVLTLLAKAPTESDTASKLTKGKGGAAEKKGAGGKGKGGDESHLAASPALPVVKKSSVALKGNWLGQSIELESDLIPAVNPAAAEQDTKAKAKGKGGVEAAPTAVDRLPLHYKIKFELPLNPAEPITSVLALPQSLAVHLIDTMQDDSVQSVFLGTFQLDCQSLTTSKAHLTGAAQFHLDPVLLADKQIQIQRMKKTLQQKITADRELDKQFLEAQTPTEQAGAVNTSPQPKKGVAKAQPQKSAQNPANEELGLRQAESAARKEKIEELTMQLQVAEATLLRYLGARPTLSFSVALNVVAEETPKPTPRVEDDKKQDPKKKKK